MKIECGYVDDGWGFSVVVSVAPPAPRERPGQAVLVSQVLLLVVGVAYLGAGIAYNSQVRGKRGLAALPHRPFWLELRALCLDGWYFTQRKLGIGDRRVGGASAPLLRAGDGDGRSRDQDGKEKKQTKEKKEKKEKGKKDKKRKEKGGGKSPPAAPAPAAPAPAPAASGTAAGGGGRWVHVPIPALR